MGFWDGYDDKTGRKKDTDQEHTTGDAVGAFAGNVAKGVGEGLYKPIEVLGEGLANSIAEFDGTNKRVADNQEEAYKQTSDIISGLAKKLKDPKLSDDERKRIKDGIAKISSIDDQGAADTQSYFDEAKAKTDPGHILNNAAQLAINIGTAGAGGAALKGAKAGAETIEATSKLGSFLNKAKNAGTAVTAPRTAGEGAAGFGLVGGAQGALAAGDNPNSTEGDILLSALGGGALGAAGGALAGKFSKPTTSPSTKVVNGNDTSSGLEDLRPFDNPQPTQPTQPVQPIQTVPTAVTTPTEPMTLNDLNASATRPVGAPVEVPAKSTSFFPSDDANATKMSDLNKVDEPKATSMAAEVTPGKQEDLSVSLKLEPEEVSQLAQSLKGMTKKEQVAQLKSMGASDEQIGKFTGNGITKKPLGVNDEGAAAQAAERAATDAPLETKLTKGIEENVDDSIPQSIKDTFSQLGDSSGRLSGAYKSAKGKTKEVLDGLSKDWDNVTNTTSKMMGKVGADWADRMQSGARVKAKLVDDTSDTVESIKDLTADKLGVKEAKDQVSRVRQAIESGDKSGLKESDQAAFDAAEKVFSTFKSEMVKQGRNVRDAYFTHAKLQSDEDNTGQIVEAMFNKGKENMESSFSKKRTGDTAGEVPDMYTLLRKYQQGMANDLAYRDAQDYITQNIDKIPTHLATDSKNMAEAKQYITDLYSHARNGGSETAVSRITKKPLDTFTDNVLRFNLGNTLKNYTDQIKTNALLTPGAKKINVPDDITKEFSGDGQNFLYGRSTKEEVGQNASRSTKLGEFADKISPNMATEKVQVAKNARKGLQEGFAQSEVYKKAKADGMNDADAIAEAWSKDKENIQRTANYISGTSSAGNAMNQIAALRNGKPLLGVVPWSAVTRFASYPINNTMTFIRNMQPAEARALQAYARGDIAGSKLADIRGDSKTLLDMYENAAKQGDTGIPKDVLDSKIQVIQNGIKLIDEELKKNSTITKGQTAQTFAKVWGATVAIQLAVVGAQDAAFNRGSNSKQKSPLGTAVTQAPFLSLDRAIAPIVNGSGIQADRGQISLNPTGIVNQIPYLGGLDSATGGNLANFLKGITKPANKAISSAYN